ncbi:hypothetical protein [uncultured Chryseobacterium sp.]|uniref:helix-turn-helix transcriptional regulator n=1 Tax=uncultured Chryseobacterium sp. TaxID=259322 RepID=UPI0025F9DB7B|nr:hypothetical protein [uncultured Chryseobacterium sp.]
MTFIIFFKKLLFLFFVINIIFIQAQKITVKEIDTLQMKASKVRWNMGDYKKALTLQKEIIIKSKKINYKKGEIRGYLEFSQTCYGMNMLKQCYYFLNIAKKLLKNFDDNSLKSHLYLIYGMYNYKLQGHTQALINFNKSLYFASRIEDKKLAERRKQNVYDWKRSSFEFLNQMDSVYSYERKCMVSPKPMLFITIANRHLEKGRVDSAEYFIDMANNLVKSVNAPMEGKCNVLKAYGRLYILRKQYEKSLQYLFEALKISKKMHLKNREREVYKLIYEAYRGQNNIEKENEYLFKYSSLNDSLNEIEKKVINLPIEDFFKEEAHNLKERKKKLYYFIVFIIPLSMSLVFVLKRNSKNRKEKTKSILNEKEQELNFLKQKVDENRQYVLYLATKNDPTFIIKFKDVYSDFYEKMLSEYPQLNINDMKFIALIKLLFSNKEIATYTNVSIRTVESKKYRIRKKLNLDANIDFNEWIINK